MTSGERANLAARTLGVVRRCAISVAPVSEAAGLALVLRHYQLPQQQDIVVNSTMESGD